MSTCGRRCLLACWWSCPSCASCHVPSRSSRPLVPCATAWSRPRSSSEHFACLAATASVGLTGTAGRTRVKTTGGRRKRSLQLDFILAECAGLDGKTHMRAVVHKGIELWHAFLQTPLVGAFLFFKYLPAVEHRNFRFIFPRRIEIRFYSKIYRIEDI